MATDSSSLSSDDKEKEMDHSVLTLTMMATLFVLIIVIWIGVVLAFILGDTLKPTAVYGAEQGTDGGVDNTEGSTTTADKAHQETVVPLLVVPLPTQKHADAPGSVAARFPKLPKTKTTRRSGMMFCVVGDNFMHQAVFSLSFCDYAIYRDLVADDGDFLPLYGNKSWKAFKQATAFNPDMAFGVSFSVTDVAEQHSTVTSIPHMGEQLMELAYRMNISAMGALDFPRHHGISTNTLQPIFTAMAKALMVQHHAEPMTFLGVWLHAKKLAQRFVYEVSSMTDVNTIIVQTHLSKSLISEGPCVSFPIGMASASQKRQLPNFEVARQAAASLRARGDKFRVMFSSTLGAMVYTGALHSPEPSSAHKPCEKAYMVNSDFTCRHNVSDAREIYDESGMYAYLAYQFDGRPYFVTFETSKSLRDKMSLYIADASDGWALFEVQRDVWKPCGLGRDYVRLEAIQQKARLRIP